MPNLIDMTGKKFNRLSVIKRASIKGFSGQVCWECVCDCGKNITVMGTSLRNGHAKSCGCLNKELTIETHTTHGMSHTPTYTSWKGMKRRCNNSNFKHYHNYGGRGIKVCEHWLKFENFLKDMGKRPEGLTLDRVNNNGNYEPGNCRWATKLEQQRNRR